MLAYICISYFSYFWSYFAECNNGRKTCTYL